MRRVHRLHQQPEVVLRAPPERDLPHLRATAPEETPETLRAEFEVRRAAQMERLLANRKRDLLNCTAAGAAAGLAAVLVTCAGTRHDLFWHSFLWEALLGGVAGNLLVRRDGGLITGVILFSASYLLATLVRAFGLDPSVIFLPSDLAMIGSIQGNMTALIAMAGMGGVLGHVIADG
jgi:hypothetical protein